MVGMATALAVSALYPAVHASAADALVAAARERLQRQVVYDGAYQQLKYPLGDVADDRGVCSDLVVRAYRGVGADLQQLVHENMRKHFRVYPKRWVLWRPDKNIDHRRVPNLRRYLQRNGDALRPSQ